MEYPREGASDHERAREREKNDSERRENRHHLVLAIKQCRQNHGQGCAASQCQLNLALSLRIQKRDEEVRGPEEVQTSTDILCIYTTMALCNSTCTRVSLCVLFVCVCVCVRVCVCVCDF